MRWAAVAAVAILIAACASGGGLPSAASATATPATTPLVEPSEAPTAAPTALASEAPSGAVTTLQDVKGATLQIESEGTFIDPEVGEMTNAAGRGSGFFIDPSGLAVTANHVVTGAAFLKIWVGGDKENVRNAKILGVSECSDLALIQVLSVGQVPFLDWYTGVIDAGLDVYAAGFPLGDPEYSLKKGIVSKARANGDTTWASIDSVIEHDAAMLPGNSGGPLVTPDGKVVGVNFASDQAGERFAVSEAEVRRILPELQTGKDVTSIGVNGQAVKDESSGVSGIWVSSVKSGSPADGAGIKAGDIITRLEGLVLSTDGTMADYCDILRGHNAGDALSVQVLRYSTKEILEGQLNGRVLAVTSSFGDAVPDTGDGQTPAEEDYPSYATVKDTTGTISMEVPEAWSDFRGGSWRFDDEMVGVGINASPDIDTWLQGFTVPGVFLGATKNLAGRGLERMLDEQSRFQQERCTSAGRHDFDDGVHVGKFDVFEKCDGGDAGSILLVAYPTDESYALVLNVTILADRDVAAADRIMDTFRVLKALPEGQADGAQSMAIFSNEYQIDGDYPAYRSVKSLSGAFTIQAPKAWTAARSGEWDDGNRTVGIGMIATTNEDQWRSTLDIPGAWLGVSRSLASTGVDGLLQQNRGFGAGACTSAGTYDYRGVTLTGRYEVFEKCTDADPGRVVLVAMPANGAYVVLFEATYLGDRDIAAVRHILRTLKVTGSLP